jgi:hypothetical protein
MPFGVVGVGGLLLTGTVTPPGSAKKPSRPPHRGEDGANG